MIKYPTREGLRKLRGRRAELGLSIADLAKIVGISEIAMARKLRGESEFRLSEVIAVSTALKLEKPDQIFFPKSFQILNGEEDVNA